MSRLARSALVALAAFLAYAALGMLVSPHPPGDFDRAAHALVGRGIPLAIVATESGLLPAYVAISLAALALAAFSRAWRGRAIFAVVALILSWQVSNVLKTVFRRARPEDWRWLHESSYSYASGHATNSIVVYGLWAFFIWHSGLPRPVRLSASGLLILWAVTVSWSRLALGAHFPTDLIGGWLLAIGMLALLRTAVEFFREVRLTRRSAAT